MNKHRFRRWLVAPAAVALGLSPILALQLSNIAGATTSSDTVKYVQSSSSSSFSYVPGNGTASTNQSITPSGTCKTPTTSGGPLIALSALVYKSTVGGVPYTGTPTAGTVGTSSGKTGVCDISPSYGINQSESLTLGLGSNALTSGRIMSEAKIPLVLNVASGRGYTGSNYGSGASATVTLIERNGTKVVGNQTLTIKGGDGDGDSDDWVTVDTGSSIVGGFTSVELRVTSCASGNSVSVVGTSILSLLALPQVITFTNTPPTNAVVGGSYTVTATGGGSGNPVTFSVDGTSTSGCSVNATTGLVTLNGPAGKCVIDANQAGNAYYSPAPQAQQSVTVGLAPQVITYTNTPPTSPLVNDTYTVTATGGASGNPVTFSVDGTSTSGCSVNSSGLVTLSGPAGTCVIDANQAGNASYSAALQVQQTVTSGLLPQAITYVSTPPTAPISGDTYTVVATGGGSGNPVVSSIDASSTSGCTIDPTTNVVTFLSPVGTCIIDSNQAGNGTYSAAPQNQQDSSVNQSICGQQTVSTESTDGNTQSGEVSASFTFLDYMGEPAPTTTCKAYTEFDASVNDEGTQSVTFDSQPLATAHVTATITWAYDGFCTPDGSGNTTICPATFVSLDGGQTFVPQTYCTSAQAANIEWCTTSRSYAYSALGTQITETWDGYGDPLFHHA